MLVRLTQELTVNVTGYDRDPKVYEPGEHDVPPGVAAFVATHPAFGEVLGESPAAPAGKPAEAKAPAAPAAPRPRVLSDLTVSELKALAAKHGIEVPDKPRKAIFDALKTAKVKPDQV